MKLSFSTLGCPSWSLARVIDAAGRYGYDGIELRFLEDGDALWERPDLRGAGARETLARLADAGLEISCVDSRSFFHHPDAAARRHALDEAKRSVDVAVAVGAPGVRVFGDRVQAGADLASTRGWIAESLAALRDAARPAGVEVWLETHGDFATGAAAGSLLELVSGEGLGVIWDPANAFSEFGESPEDGAHALGLARIRHVHLKDERRPAPPKAPLPWTPVLMGAGEFPAVSVLQTLQGLGYDRWVSFEWEKRWHPQIEEPEIALPHFVAWASRALREGSYRRTADTADTTDAGSRADARLETPAAGASSFLRGRLEVRIHETRAAMGTAAAALVSARLQDSVARAGRVAVIFASAPSQNEFLAALRADSAIDWRRVTAFHLDEYVGIRPSHPASFRRFLRDRLFDHVPVCAFHELSGEAPDLAAECSRYAALLGSEGPTLAILGIGENGHLAFIDPPVCDFRDPTEVRTVELDEVCRRQQVHDGSFARLEDVPRTALSLTVPFLLRVPRAVAVVPGPAKTAAIAAALDGPVSTACPASVLRRHPDATLFLDRESAAGLAERKRC
jgi:glucosamine-6-phosphate deaminase